MPQGWQEHRTYDLYGYRVELQWRLDRLELGRGHRRDAVAWRYRIADGSGGYLTGCPSHPWSGEVETFSPSEVLRVAGAWLRRYVQAA